MCIRISGSSFTLIYLGHARMHGCMKSKRGLKRSHESTQAQSGQLDIRSCFNGITKDELVYSNANSVPSKTRVISHVGRIIAAACNDHRVNDVSTKIKGLIFGVGAKSTAPTQTLI